MVLIDAIQVGYGVGASKKEAEQHAAFSVSQSFTDTRGDNFMNMIDRSCRAPESGKGKEASDE